MKRLLGTGMGLLITLILVLLALRLPVLGSLQLIISGSLSNWYGISATLVKAIPLILTGIGVAVAWKAGMFSIGGEGQFLTGGILSATLFKFFPAAPAPVLIIAGVLGGAAFASVAAWLYVSRGIQIVISTILLNFVAVQLLSWAVTGPLRDPKSGVPMSTPLPSGVMLSKFDPKADLHTGIIIATICAIALAVYFGRTVGGFRLRLVGHSVSVARANLIPVASTQFKGMALSGALCGLAGAVEYVGLGGQLSMGFAQNWGFLAIPVAILGGLNPLGIILSAGFFAALLSGSENLGRFTPAGSAIVYVVQAVAVLGFLAFQAQIKKSSAAVIV